MKKEEMVKNEKQNLVEIYEEVKNFIDFLENQIKENSEKEN